MQQFNTIVRHRLLPALLLGALLAAAGVFFSTPPHEAVAAEAAPPVPQQKLVRGHWSENPEIMRKNHKELLLDGMTHAARATTRKEDNTIERCVTCHIVRDGEKPVSAADPRHFCNQCHAKAGVSINCFTCHASLPTTDPAVMSPEVRNADVIKARLQQWQKYTQEQAAKGAGK